jgi:hypothetical protein
MTRRKTQTGLRPQTIGVKTIRYITRAKQRGRKCAYEYPCIHVGGLWLRTAGFRPGDVLVPEITRDGDLLLRRA